MRPPSTGVRNRPFCQIEHQMKRIRPWCQDFPFSSAVPNLHRTFQRGSNSFTGENIPCTQGVFCMPLYRGVFLPPKQDKSWTNLRSWKYLFSYFVALVFFENCPLRSMVADYQILLRTPYRQTIMRLRRVHFRKCG